MRTHTQEILSRCFSVLRQYSGTGANCSISSLLKMPQYRSSLGFGGMVTSIGYECPSESSSKLPS